MLKTKRCNLCITVSVLRMKDILLINNKAKATGIGTYSFNLYDNLKRISKRNLDFITLKYPFEESHESAIQIFPQNIRKLLFHLEFLRKIPHSYKVYHILNPNLGIMLSKLRPTVVTVHDVSVLKGEVSKELMAESYGLDIPLVLAMQLNTSFIRNADRILCVSNYTKATLTSVLGIKNKRVVVSYPGIDRHLFRPRDKFKTRHSLGLPLNKRIILHVGTDEPRKNTRALVEALYMVKKRIPDAIFVKIGGMQEATRKLILALGLGRSIIYHKKVPSVAPFYNAADLFVFPSYYEGFGYPAAEAMASGCPIIAADSSSVTEVVGKGGVLFPPFDVAALYEAINEVLTDSNKRTVMIKEGLEQVKKFDWKKCAETTLETYETL
jgi:glycosyltransferase involved in cell wall biosynthesis